MARRRFTVFSLSFLDIMSCGFGAVVLIFLIINHATEVEYTEASRDQLSELRKLDYEVSVGQKDLTELRDSLKNTQNRIDETRRKRVSLVQILEQKRSQLDDADKNSQALLAHLNQLKSDIETREQEVKKLKAKTEQQEGTKIRSVVGEGDRQYLTGLKVGGNRILIAVDKSASMLDDTIVNVIRRRNMPDQRKLKSPKWQRAIATAEWLSAQIPLESQFQVLTFDTQTNALAGGRVNQWFDATSAKKLNQTLKALKKTIPSRGTNLEGLFTAIGDLSPLPDNVYLIVDGLPTQGMKAPRKATVSGRDRLKLFREASRKLPPGIPINIIMFPMEGDPSAAAAFWDLAQHTGGSFLSPSKDWP